MDVRYLLFLLLLVSCLPEPQVSTADLTNVSTNQSTGGGTTGVVTIPELETQWNYLGSLSKNISINSSNLNNSYIVGKDIETFLGVSGNYAEDYCLISRYTIGGLNYELRSRVVPISYYDFTARRTIKIFRVDFNDLTNSQNICSSLPLLVLDANNNLASNTEAIAVSTFNPALLCPTCTSVITTSKMMFFKKTALDLRQLTVAQVDVRSLSLSINPNNNTTTNMGSCTQAQCAARGFDCCLENQCITDGAKRPAALTTYASQFAAAEQERLNNPLAYLNYPHLYYICGSSVPVTTTGSTYGGYTQGLEQLKKDYFCVEHMKKNKTGVTFHQDLLSGVTFFPDELDIPDVNTNPATLYPTDIECRNDTDPNSNMYFKKVAERLYQNCGCSKTNLADMVASCPAYEYSVNYVENSGLPNRIDCYTPPNSVLQIPTQQTVSVSSKTAPHRYFRSCGDEFGTNTSCTGGDSQEGDIFEYQDVGNILPSQENFGMNSILGQMNVTLDKALPAKSVAVELDQVYLISTTSGFYSPCPTCGKDSWFSSFTAYPTSAYGTGIQSVGHSTTRDAFGYNSTGGNYEDTIFGRACWIPPTMIPFSHYPFGSVQSQRLNRLKTQAALFSNGYQRDWYGFNKGALIGSFDGVTWFAVGKGRIVKSTSKKLYLAINAPFADLASPTMHVVNVQAYDGISEAAQLDYDPQYHQSHPYQNEAGNCQANHLCSTDTDCISRLGWEYMCANVQDIKTQWPTFDVDAKEKPNASAILTIDQVLQQKRFPSASTKRCIYRGSGSLCVQTPTIISDLNKRKTLTCAPNFYCANVNSSGPVFNSKVSRYAANLQDIPVNRNHYYGKDANVLGRPLSYTSSTLTTYLPSEIRTSLTQNMIQYEPGASLQTGLCLPGKALASGSESFPTLQNPYDQHKQADSLGRTDFISQIGGCNAGLFTSYRYSSCPVISPDGNYEFLSSTYSLANYHIRARNQNSCGLDSLLSTTNLLMSVDSLSVNSPFRLIESKPLNTQTVIEPSIPRDACLRRAGQVCHTDLDCGPNKMHADQTENFSLAYFGNQAEKSYYSEYLVCAQADAKPSPLDTVAYKAFEMNKNRCCREAGLDLTTYTSYVPRRINTNSVLNTNSTTLDDTYDSGSYGLKMTMAPGMSPNDPLRYSRLATVENLGTLNRPPLNAFQDKSGLTLLSAQGANVMTPYQWKTLSEANSESCCGGGWVRKFSDGGNDWSKRDRVYIDVKNFACINSRTPLLTHPEDFASSYTSAGDVVSLTGQDISSYCKDASGTKGSCAQYSIRDNVLDLYPTAPDNFVPPSGPGDTNHLKTFGMTFSVSSDFYFYPRSADGDTATIIVNSTTNGRRNISIKIPSYITRNWDNTINNLADGSGTRWDPGARVHMFDVANEATISDACTKKTSLLTSLHSPTVDGTGLCTVAGDGSHCCYAFDIASRTLKVVPAVNGNFGPGVIGKRFAVKLINASTAGTFGSPVVRQKPGSNTYYLKRLGRLELSGIPQITFEPLTCSDNSDRVVPGLFKKTAVTDMRIGDFIHSDFSFIQSLTDPDTGTVTTSSYTNRYGLDHEPVFAESEFKCCTPLGKSNTDPTKCCSGHGISQGTGNSYTCALPAGANLMVYFNRFVTNEGIGSDKPGGGLTESDFNYLTGEPKISNTVNQKIYALGAAYCDSGKVRQGGAFGEFNLEPSGNDTNMSDKIYGIVDSSNDYGQLSNAGGTFNVGYNAFMSGYRWNHHLYCDD
jgi:hypothetical protein